MPVQTAKNKSDPDNYSRNTRLAVGLLFVVTVMILGAALSIYKDLEKQDVAEAENYLEAVVDLKSREIETWLNELNADAEVLRGDYFLAAAVETWLMQAGGDAQAALLSRRLESIRQAYHYRDVLLLDKDANILLSAKGGALPSAMDFKYLHEAFSTEQIVVVDLHREEQKTGKPIEYDIIVPITTGASNQKRMIAALYIYVDVNRFLFPRIQSWPFPSNSGETLLVRREGDTVVFMNDLRFRQNAAFELRFPVEQSNLPAAMVMRDLTGVIQGQDYRGINVLAAVRKIHGTNWALISKVDIVEIFEPIRTHARNMLWLVSLFLLGTFLVFFIWLRGIKASHEAARQNAELQQQALKKHFDYLTKYANDIILLTNDEGVILEANDRASEIYQYAKDELPGKNILQLEASDYTQDKDNMLSTSHDGLLFETTHLKKDQSSFPVEVSLRNIRVEDNHYRQLIIRDITERRQAEEKLNKANRLYAILSLVNQAIVRETDKQKLFQEICNIAVEFGKFRLAWIGLLDEENKLIKPVAYSGEDSDCLQHIEISLSNVMTRNEPVTRSLLEGKSAVFNDLRNNPDSVPWCAQVLKTNCLASAAFPLRLNNSTIGTLNVCAIESYYFEKDEISLLEKMAMDISFALEKFEEEANRKQAEERESNLGQILQRSLNELYVFDAETLKFILLNRGALENLGYNLEEVTKLTPVDINPEFNAESFERLVEPLRNARQELIKFIAVHRRKDGSLYPVEVHLQLMSYQSRPAFVAIILDITERQQIDEALRRTQKMESIGQLSGGIAHDFNNLLTIIQGNLEILKRTIGADQQQQKWLEKALNGVRRGAALTNKMLSFSRSKSITSGVYSVNAILAEMEDLLHKSLTPKIMIKMQLAEDVWLTDVNEDEFQDALVNLVLNARDAMAEGGQLAIETTNTVLDEDYAKHNLGVAPGEYVLVSVSDTGSGMSKAVQAHLFEPFFTTKEVGKGTGLGLSMVYGFMHRSGGHIKVYSEEGHGTTARLYLPRASGKQSEPDRQTEVAAELPGGTEAVLVVDDEPELLEICQAHLEALGYRVQVAGSALEALAVLNGSAGEIALLFSDVLMPGGMDGYELAKQVKQRWPSVKILLSSGFANHAMQRNELSELEAGLLHKPYTHRDLAVRVRQILDNEEQRI